MKIKTRGEKVMFNMSERQLCKKCGFPEGFCKHTIEKEYQELCPETPLSQESIQQLVRSYAICLTEKRNICSSLYPEVDELKRDMEILRAENTELKHFKKHIEDVLSLLAINHKKKQAVLGFYSFGIV